ncbi:MAG: tetratricopeptide repeat protein [Usitatibacter sp.]
MSAAGEELRKAVEEFSRGRIDEASRLCQLALARDGGDAGALHLAAAIALLQGRYDVALAQADAAIRSNPRDATQYQTRGQANVALGMKEAAESDFRKAIELSPGFPEAHASLGARLLDRGQFAAAHAHLETALGKNPGVAQWRYNLALCETGLGHGEAAERHLSEVLRIDPSFAPAWRHVGVVRLAAGDTETARRCFERSLDLEPSSADGWTGLGSAKRRAGDREGAERAYRTALEQAPGNLVALQNLGNILRERGRLDESKAILERCVANAGGPYAHFGLALTRLTLGELAAAWQEYRWRDGVAPDPGAGSALRAALDRRQPIVLTGEQGLGDILFFLRWVPMLAADPATLTLRCDARLHAIVARAGLIGHFEDEAFAAKPGELSIRVGDLPALLWRGKEEHPPAVPLEANPAALEAARQALRGAGASPYVAVAWRAGLAPGASEERLFKSVPLDKLGAALRDIPGTLVSVQRNPMAGEIEALSRAAGRPVLDASAFNDDLARITGMMAAVDSYVGVSSTNVHLRAGLGLGAAILVPFPPEWRYGAEGAGTPWYPDFRLYREHPSRGWDEALSAMSSGMARPHR